MASTILRNPAKLMMAPASKRSIPVAALTVLASNSKPGGGVRTLRAGYQAALGIAEFSLSVPPRKSALGKAGISTSRSRGSEKRKASVHPVGTRGS